MQPDQPQDNVWVSREEYDRLRAAEQSLAMSRPIAPTPVVSSWNAPAEGTLEKMRKQQIIVSTILGLGFVLGLTVTSLGWLVGPIALLFIIFTIVSYEQSAKTKRRMFQPIAAAQPKQPRSTAKLILLIIGCILLVPIIAYGSMIVFVIILFTLGGGQGS